MNRIKELRDEFGMSQVRLSIELGVSQETISAYENEKHYPMVENLIKMRNLFSASFDYILGYSDVRIPKDGEFFPTEELQLLALFHALDQTKQQKAVAYMQGLLD